MQIGWWSYERLCHALKLWARKRAEPHLIEPQFVDKTLENERVVGEERNSPLPIIKANRAGDNLLHLTCIATSYKPMFVHLSLALFDREGIPVLVFASTTIHWIEADV